MTSRLFSAESDDELDRRQFCLLHQRSLGQRYANLCQRDLQNERGPRDWDADVQHAEDPHVQHASSQCAQNAKS